MSKAAVWTSFWYSVRWNAHVSPRGWLRRHLGSTSRMLTPNLCAQAWEPLAELPGLPQSTLTSNFACPSVRTLVFCRSMRTTQRNIRFYYPLPTPRVALPVGGDSWQEDQLPASSTALQASGVMAGTSWAFIAWVTVLSPENKRKKERKMPKSMSLADHLITRSN